MNTLLLAALTNANYHDDFEGHKVKITTKAAGGHKYKFNSKYFSVSEAFKHVLKKDKPSNQCESVAESLVMECPQDYDLVKDVRYPFCEFVTLEPFELTCPGVKHAAECLELTSKRECPEGYHMDKKLHTCNKTEIGDLTYECPDDEYVVMDGKKGKYCEKTIQQCEFVCPSGSFRDPSTDLCTERIPVHPPICPDGFELSEDETFCFADITRPCGKHDLHIEKHHDKDDDKKAHHLRRLDAKKHDDHKLKYAESKYMADAHKDTKYKKMMHEKPMPALKLKEKEFHDKYGYKVHGPKKEKVKHVKSDVKGKKADFITGKLINKGLCTYQEISPVIPSFELVTVPEVEECKDVIDMQPVERVCEDGFELVQQYHKEPACVKTDTVDAVCPDGLIELNKMCYVELPKSKTCPIGFRLTDDELFCTKSDIVAPKYQWLLARQCEGYKCIDYYENSCIFK